MEKTSMKMCIFSPKKSTKAVQFYQKIILFPAYNVCKKTPEIVINLLKDMPNRVSNKQTNRVNYLEGFLPRTWYFGFGSKFKFRQDKRKKTLMKNLVNPIKETHTL